MKTKKKWKTKRRGNNVIEICPNGHELEYTKKEYEDNKKEDCLGVCFYCIMAGLEKE